jgi:hypothetical protein
VALSAVALGAAARAGVDARCGDAGAARLVPGLRAHVRAGGVSGTFGNLDDGCPTCGRRSGSHTLDEMAACSQLVTTDDAFTELSAEQRFQVPEGTVIADNVKVKALVMHGGTELPALTVDPLAKQVRLDMPAVHFRFETSGSGVLRPVAEVLFVGGEDAVRGLGRLVRDTANGAVNVAKRAQAKSPRQLRGARWQGHGH